MAIETAATLLEREREFTAVGDVLAASKQRHGRVILIEAPAGLGKTSLLAAASDVAAEAGFFCASARATELERAFAYGCVRQLLEPTVALLSEAEREGLFTGAAALSKPLFAPTGESFSGSTPDSAFSMLHGLYWLLNNLAAEAPLALLVDDLHWSDGESLRFLVYLAPRLDGLPIAVVATARPGEGHPAELARLAAAPETSVIRPRPLSVEATTTLAERRLGSGVAPEFATACRDTTLGNPFFLEALLREVSEERLSPDSGAAVRVRDIGPPAIAQAVDLRLAEQPAAATALVNAVAVLGDGSSLAEAARLAELSEPDAAAAADLLVSLAILKPAQGLEFVHPIVREAVYGDIGPGRRAQAHARAAEILASAGGADERIAAQLVEAHPAADAERVALLRRVAGSALARGAPAAAVGWLRRALAEPPPPEDRAQVLMELGSAELRLGASEAVDHLAEAIELLQEPGLLATPARQLALALSISGNSDRAVGVLESAVGLVEPVDRELGLLLEAELASHAQQAGLETRAPAARRLERHGDLEGATPGERLVLASLALERAKASESASEAAEYLEAALANGRLLAEYQLDLTGPFYDLVIGLLATDALDVAAVALDQALVDARARASIPHTAYLTSRRGWVSFRRGAVAQAEADARTTIELLTSHGIPLGIPLALALLIEALIEAGDAEAAEQALRRSGLGAEIRPGLTNNYLLQARSLLHLARGRTSEGLDDMLEFGRRAEAWGGANPLASRWRSRASLALATLGDGDAARGMAAEDLERARRWGAASGIGVALHAVALVEGGEGSIDRLRQAREVLEASPARLEYARAMTDLGAALRRANRRAEARGELEKALELSERCGARALAGRARTELSAAGGRSSDPEGSGVEQLTVSERRVAELAAEGQSNPEIAQTLFVTRKTVETHLGRVYRKLDISGRGALGRVFAEQGSAGDA